MTAGKTTGFRSVPRDAQLWQLVEAHNKVLQGKINAVVSSFTLSTISNTTVLVDVRIGFGSFIDFMPTTVSASAAKTAGPFFVSTATIKTGSAILTHANQTALDATFRPIIVG